MAYQESDVYALVLGRTIAQLRERMKWTQAVLAERLGVAQSSMSRFEKGQVQPEPYQLRQIAALLHVEEAIFAQLVSSAMKRTETLVLHAGLPGIDPWWRAAFETGGAVGIAGLVTFAVSTTLTEQAATAVTKQSKASRKKGG